MLHFRQFGGLFPQPWSHWKWKLRFVPRKLRYPYYLSLWYITSSDISIVRIMLLCKILFYNVDNNHKATFSSHGSPHLQKLRFSRTGILAFLAILYMYTNISSCVRDRERRRISHWKWKLRFVLRKLRHPPKKLRFQFLKILAFGGGVIRGRKM